MSTPPIDTSAPTLVRTRSSERGGAINQPRPGSGPVYQLDREWIILARGPIAAALPGWRRKHRPLRRFETPQRLLSFLNTASAEMTDPPLLALLALARDERLAARLLLQAILPALKCQAERIACEPGRRDEVWELLLFFAWEAICAYPIERRRFRVAANLVLQVLHDTTRELRRPQFAPDAASPRDPTLGCVLVGVHASELEAVQPTGALRLGADGFLMEAAAAGVVALRDADLILRTRVDGVSLRLIARVEGVGYHALRQRRQRAEKRLRAFLGASRTVSNARVSDLISDGGSPTRPSRAPAAPDRRGSGSRAAA